MKPELFWVSDVLPARLAIMARPRSGEWLQDEIRGWKAAGVEVVVSLLESSEVYDLELEAEPDACRVNAIEFVSFPFPDRSVPSSDAAVFDLVSQLVQKLRASLGVAIHCRAGIGRSSVIAGCILARLGVSFPSIFPALSRARGISVPDTAGQVDWVKRFTEARGVAL